jgi:hypothetical protein
MDISSDSTLLVSGSADKNIKVRTRTSVCLDCSGSHAPVLNCAYVWQQSLVTVQAAAEV